MNCTISSTKTAPAAEKLPAGWQGLWLYSYQLEKRTPANLQVQRLRIRLVYFVLKSNMIKHKNLIKRECDASLRDLTTSKTEEVLWLGKIAISLSWKSQESKKHVILHCEAKAFLLWVMHKYLEIFQVTLMKVFMKVESTVVYHRQTAIQAVWPAPRYFSTTPTICGVKSAITLQHSVMADS